MSSFVQRVKGVFKKNPRPQNLPPGSFPNAAGGGGGGQALDTITKPPYQTDEDDEDEDIESLKNYNVPEQTRLRGQQRDTIQSDGSNRSGNPYGNGSTLPAASLNPPNAQFRGASSGFLPDLPTNNNTINPPPNTNTGSILGPSSRSQISPIPTPTNNPQPSFSGFPPGMNPNQSMPPPSTNNPQSSSRGFPPGMNLNQSSPPPANPTSSFGGFPPGINPNQSMPPPSANNPQSPSRGFPPGMNLNQSLPPPANPTSSFGGFPPGMNPNQSAVPPPANPPSSFSGFPPGMNPNQSAQPPSTNNPPSSFSGFPPGMNPNQSAQRPPANPPSSFSGFPPGMGLNQTQPSSGNNQPSLSGFPPGMSSNQATQNSATTNPQSSVPNFLLGMKPNSSSTTQVPPTNNNNSMNPQQGSSTNLMSSFRNQSNEDDNVSRLELDYPIENVLIDADIPSTIALKINETVEQDRLGNAYHVHRYTFEPSSQQISLGNNQHIERRAVGNSHHGGMRHIREIHNDDHNPLFDDTDHHRSSNKRHRRRRHYSETSVQRYVDKLLHTPGSIVIEAQNLNDLQQIIGRNQLNTQTILSPPPPINSFQSTSSSFQSTPDSFPGPIFYYTATALPMIQCEIITIEIK